MRSHSHRSELVLGRSAQSLMRRVALLAAVMCVALTTSQLAPSRASASTRHAVGCTSDWRQATVGGTGVLFAVTALSSQDAWAVGFSTSGSGDATRDTPRIEHWNGSQWLSSLSPSLPFSGILQAVYATGPRDIWAVGESWTLNTSVSPSRDQFSTLAENWNGSRWRIVRSPSPGGYLNELWSVSGTSASNIWAIGVDGNWNAPGPPSLIEHWDGSTWSVVPAPTSVGLMSVVALSSSNAWVVGWSGQSGGQEVLLRWTGSTWQSTPIKTENNFIIHQMIGTQGSPTWAVGERAVGSYAGAQIFSWDRQTDQWRSMTNPVPSGVTSVLTSVAAASPTDVWAVGNTSSTTLVEHWNGRWSVDRSVALKGGTLQGVAVSPGSSKVLFAVGWTTASSGTTPLIETRCA